MEIPNATIIEDYAFYNCNSLKSIKMNYIIVLRCYLFIFIYFYSKKNLKIVNLNIRRSENNLIRVFFC